MGKYVNFKIIAEREDGSYTKFALYDNDKTPRPERGHTHDAAVVAAFALHNRLAVDFQGENE